ncbi:MAG: gliding motility-associated C-terminal domain-containing protein [Bacteroidota bacterium]
MKKTTCSFFVFSNWTKIYSVLLVILLMATTATSQNLIPNGDFESGTTGFTSDYWDATTQAPFGPMPHTTSSQRTYYIMNDPYNFNTSLFAHSIDHTSGSGNMMVVDGSNGSGDKIWQLNNGSSIGVISGKKYEFSYWIKSISSTNTVANSAVIIINTNGTTSAPVLTSGSATSPTGAPSAWTKVTYTWTATTSNAQIWMTDATTSGTGNDFAIDDITLTAIPDPLTFSYAAVNPTCPNGSDGYIAGYAAGGVAPYSFTLNGTTTNSTGIFTGLSASTGNTISVTDGATSTLNATGITITNPIDPLTVNATSPICSGASANLSASGGSSGIYNWTSNPVDPTLSVTGASPTANPTVTTMYYVTTNNTTIKELIYNGHFDNSTNVGFNTDYSNIPNNDANKVQKAFGIVVNPKTFESGFSICPDHTTSGGNQMVVDGSTNANDRVWSQTIPVTQATTYTFSYYIQTVSGSSPALIETQINGAPITGVIATSRFTAPSAACSWSNVTYTWNSGAATSAVLTLIDRNLAAAGNDFALDDLSFYTTTICPLIDSVQVSVNPAGTPVTGFSYTTPVCKTGTNPTPIKVSGFSSGGTFSATPSGLSINTTTGIIDLSLSTVNTYTVTYTYAASGCNPLATGNAGITIIAAPSAGTLSGIQNICVGTNTTFSSTVSGGIWSSSDDAKATINSSTGTINGIAAGTVTMTYTITGTGGCSNATATRTVTVTDPSTAGTLSGSQNICVGGNTTFSSTISGGSWTSSDNTKASINSSTGAISGVAAGTVTMTYTVTGTNGCSNVTATRTVTVTDPPSAGTLSGSQNICIGGSTTFSSTISGGAWTSGDNTKATINSSTGAITSIGAGTITMTYTVTGTNGCSNATATRDVIIAATPTAGTLSGVQTVCVGNTTTFSSTILGGSWSSSDIVKAPIDATTGVISGVGVVSATMTYKVTGTNGCSDATATRTVTVNPLLALSAETKTCEPGNISYSVSFTATAGTAPYTATGSGAPGTWVANTWTSGLITAGSNYSIAVHDVNNCNTINVNGLSPDCSCPAKAVVTGGGSACDDATNLTINIALSGTAPWSITYTNGTTSTTVNNILVSPYTFQTNTPGTYVVTVVSDATCTGTSSGNALVNIIPMPSVTISGSTAICPNNTTTLSFSGTPNAIVTYKINNGGNQTIPLNGSGTASLTTASLNATTTYDLVSVSTTGSTICSQTVTGSATVTMNSATVPVTIFTYSASTACLGDANPTLVPGSGFTNGGTFTANPAGLSLDANTGAINVAASLPNAYTITYSVVAKGCSPANSSTTNLTITPLATPVTNFSYSPNSVCINGSDPVLVPASGFTAGGTFSSSPSGLTINANTGAITVAGSLPNTYTVTYSVAATNCSSAKSGTATFTINSLPVAPTVSKTEPTCATPTGTITVTSTLTGLSFSNDGINYTNTSGIFSGIAAGASYSITAKNVNGCISSATTGTVGIVPGAPASPGISVTQPTCTNATATITASTAVSFFSNDGINYTNTSGIFMGIPAGSNYSITLKDAAGCISSPATGTINAQPPIPAQPGVSITHPTCAISTGTIRITSALTGLSFSNEGTDYSNTTGIFTNMEAGTVYSITAKNASGCISPATTVNIDQQPPPTIANAGPDKRISVGETVQLSGTASGNNVSIVWTPNIAITGSTSATPMVSPITEQLYTMTVTSIDGCIAADNVTVSIQRNVIIPNVFSPNGDGINDTWKISYIEDYPEVKVDIFNRYGQFIFSSVGYDIKWDGTYNGQKVPVGAYYWIIKLRPDLKPMSGTIAVVK